VDGDHRRVDHDDVVEVEVEAYVEAVELAVTRDTKSHG
jgi:hypothetical protein